MTFKNKLVYTKKYYNNIPNIYFHCETYCTLNILIVNFLIVKVRRFYYSIIP